MATHTLTILAALALFLYRLLTTWEKHIHMQIMTHHLIPFLPMVKIKLKYQFYNLLCYDYCSFVVKKKKVFELCCCIAEKPFTGLVTLK